jgi:hypothetical protein
MKSLPLEMLLDVGGNFLAEVQQYTSVPTLTEKAKTNAWLAQLGARGTYQVLRGLDAHLSLALGLQSQTVRTTLPFFLGQTESTGVAGRFALAAGCGYRLGPGRALAQVQFDWASKQVAGLAGSTSGFQAILGYLVTVR